MDTNLKNIITKDFAWHYRIIPVSENENEITFNISNIQDSKSIKNDLEIILGKNIYLIPYSDELIEKELNINYRISKESNHKTTTNDSLINIIKEAINLGSSDIHFEIYENTARIRFRIDGVLIERKKIDKEDYKEIVNRIKIQANLDISEKRLPQDGRTKISEFDIRVSILPTHFGEKIVMRILGQDTSDISIDDLGFDNIEKQLYLDSIKKSNGIILISGPTGSGKTTTLYATLKLLNKIKRNILTIEDPVEYTIDGINQVQLNEDIGLTFSNALRSFLRQDPDIIMLGEIRDKETAEMAIRASLTGHLVFSTLHTNSALGTISRLIDMEIPSFLLGETINLSVAQRLVRKLCVSCKEKKEIQSKDLPENYSQKNEIKTHFIAKGCSNCHYTGYTGRRAIYEIVPIDKNIVKHINNKNENDDFLLNYTHKTLAEKAFNLLKKGETSLNEIYPLLISK